MPIASGLVRQDQLCLEHTDLAACPLELFHRNATNGKACAHVSVRVHTLSLSRPVR